MGPFFEDFIDLSLDYIKELRLKDHLSMECPFSMEMLRTHAYSIPLESQRRPWRRSTWFYFYDDPKLKGKFWGLIKAIPRTGEAV